MYRLTHDKNLNESTAEKINEEELVYEGSLNQVTLWDVSMDVNKIQRYTVHIYTKFGNTWRDSLIRSGKFRLGGSLAYPVQIGPNTPISYENLRCTAKESSFSSGPYGNNVEREWVIYPTVEGTNTLTNFDGISITISRMFVECNYDTLTLMQFNTKQVIWQGGCVRDTTFVIKSRTPNEPISVVLKSDGSFSYNLGISIHYELLLNNGLV